MKRGAPGHPKMYYLADLLGVGLAEAVGTMELLWHFTARFAIQGDIGKHSNQSIAEAAHWHRPTGVKGLSSADKLIDSLVAAGFLDRDPDYRLLVHDWDQHADQAVNKTMKNRGLDFIHPSLEHQIYFIRSKATGLIKIGTTRRTVAERLGELQINSGEPLELLAVHSGGTGTELAIHSRFTHLQLKGEWYSAERELLDYIELIKTVSGKIPEKFTRPLPEPLPEPFRSAAAASSSLLKAAAPATELQQQQQAPLASAVNGHYGRAERFIKRLFPDTDDRLIEVLILDSRKTFVAAGRNPELVTDELLLQALEQSTKIGQRSAALYLSTVAAWMKNWATGKIQ